MMNPAALMRLGKAKDVFVQNHPKFPLFLKAVNQQAVKEGSIIEIKVTAPDGKELHSNLRLQATDIELIHELSKLEG